MGNNYSLIEPINSTSNLSAHHIFKQLSFGGTNKMIKFAIHIEIE